MTWPSAARQVNVACPIVPPLRGTLTATRLPTGLVVTVAAGEMTFLWKPLAGPAGERSVTLATPSGTTIRIGQIVLDTGGPVPRSLPSSMSAAVAPPPPTPP